MSDPTFENKGTKYLFAWPDYFLEAQVSRIHANSERTVCHLVFTSTHEEANPHILQTRFNLESSRSRSELAKDMGTRYTIKEVIDWKNVLEYISVKTLQEYEKGEPVLLLTSLDEVTPLEYLIQPIAPLGKPTVLFGDPGAGKSQTSVVLSTVMTLPWADNPLRLKAPPEPMKALFLDYEADENDLRRLLRALANGHNLGYIDLHYRRCATPIAKDIEAIQNHIESIGAKCLIIDSVSLAAGGDLNSMETATAYFRALRETHITSISLAHTSKDRERAKTILGSVLFEAGARSVWEVRGKETEDTLDIALYHTKSNLAKKSPPLGMRITYESESAKVSWLDPTSIPEFIERMSLQTQILEILKSGSMTPKDLLAELDTTENTLRKTLSIMKGKEKIIKVGDGYGLPYH